MSLLKAAALVVPPIRRLYDSRNALAAELSAVRAREEAGSTSGNNLGSPFFHYFAVFDPIESISRHAAPDIVGRTGLATNFLGVLIDPKVYPPYLSPLAGKVEAQPIPANWHADISEWGAALRAVDLARGSFTVMELGCGWGCWLNSTGVAARRRGLAVTLVGIEGDRGHVTFAEETTVLNGFAPAQVTIHHGIAAVTSGVALFPRQERAGGLWDLEPVLGASGAERHAAAAAGTHEELPMVALEELASPLARIDLLHIDIQGGEADLIAGSLGVLANKVAYMVIGTHSRQIEGRLVDTLLGAGWTLEIERSAILVPGPSGPVVSVDGVQGWRNPRLLPPT